jgi:hypothetical protein
MTGDQSELRVVERERRRLRRWIALPIIAVLVAGGLIVFGRHHRNAPRHEATAAAPLGCGRELDRPPGSGAGPIDGGLIVTLAQIPAITRPVFEPASAARQWLPADAPVIVVQRGRDVRAYPLAILQWHEVVDDTVGGHPIAVTYCPLCNTALVYSRVVAGAPVQLKASGALLQGAAVLVDPASDLLWSQVTGQPYPNFGRLAGGPLTWVPSDTLGLAAAAESYPGLRVLARPTDFGYDYASSPYGHVADGHSLPALYLGWVDERLPPKTRLVWVTVAGTAKAWRYDRLRRDIVHEDVVGGSPVVVIYRAHVTGIGDAADLRVAPQTGSAAVFDARSHGHVLHFARAGPDLLRDRETGTRWDLSGRAIAGPLAGARLTPLRYVDTYWFAWVALHPGATVWPALAASACSR